jgi:hypothetical protein
MVSAVTLGRQPKGAPPSPETPMAPPATAKDICPRQEHQASPGLVSSAQILPCSPLDQVGPTRMNLRLVLRIAGRIPFPAPYLAVSRAPRGPNVVHGASPAERGEISWKVSGVTLALEPRVRRDRSCHAGSAALASGRTSASSPPMRHGGTAYRPAAAPENSPPRWPWLHRQGHRKQPSSKRRGATRSALFEGPFRPPSRQATHTPYPVSSG